MARRDDGSSELRHCAQKARPEEETRPPAVSDMPKRSNSHSASSEFTISRPRTESRLNRPAKPPHDAARRGRSAQRVSFLLRARREVADTGPTPRRRPRVEHEHRRKASSIARRRAAASHFRHRRGERADGAEQRAGEAVAGEHRRARIRRRRRGEQRVVERRKRSRRPLLGLSVPTNAPGAAARGKMRPAKASPVAA